MLWLELYLENAKLLHCAVQGLKYVPVTIIIGWWLWSLIGHLPVTFDGSPNFDVADNLDGAYLGRRYQETKTGVSVAQQKGLIFSKNIFKNF